ncbi:unnamed protein product [Linum tenue]|uniref:Uncharacterized protein n=1 Tax=Linum tenue TaxID=586396 RepID=A0AAV0H2Z7_9ROSI|nr:unnamed protein product [Linum tenue]
MWLRPSSVTSNSTTCPKKKPTLS